MGLSGLTGNWDNPDCAETVSDEHNGSLYLRRNHTSLLGNLRVTFDNVRYPSEISQYLTSSEDDG